MLLQISEPCYIKAECRTVKSILDGVTMGTAGRPDAHDPMVGEANGGVHQQVKQTAVLAWTTHACVSLHVRDWIVAHQEDPILKVSWSGFPPIKYGISNSSWETTPQ